MAALQGTKRVWKQESEFKNMADAELVQQEIDYVASQDVNGKCKNQDLVDYARQNPLSETHKCMEWNNQIAGEKYRLHQAARIKDGIRTIVISEPVVKVKKEEQQELEIKVATNHSLPTPGEGHKSIEIILNDKGDTLALEKEMYHAIEIFANSFVVEASDSAGNLSNIMYASISAERKRERSFATNICSDNIVRKMPLYSEGIKGLEKLHCNIMNMKSRGLTVLPLEITENHAEMSYIREGTLSKYMKDLSYREPSDDVRNEIYAIVDRIYEDILKSSEQVAEEKNCLNKFAPELDWGPVLRICYLEMIPVNTFIKKRDDGFDLVYFDQEFTYENCPAIFPLTRAIYDIYALSPLVEKHIPKKEMLEHYNLTELWEPSRKAEDEFQLWLRNRDVYVARGRWSSVYPRIINNSIKELEGQKKEYYLIMKEMSMICLTQLAALVEDKLLFLAVASSISIIWICWVSFIRQLM